MAKAEADPKPKATCSSTAPALLDPESEKEPLFTSEGEVEHSLLRTPNVKKSHVKLDTYGQGKAEFELREPAGSWQKSPSRQSALKVMMEVDVKRRRFEALKPDLCRKVDGKRQSINMGDLS